MTKEQLGSLVIASEDMMYHVAKTLLRSDADCADAIQETIVKAFSKVHTLKIDAYAKTWLTRILINECYTILRSNQRLEIWGSEEFEKVTGQGNGTEQYIENGEFRRTNGNFMKTAAFVQRNDQFQKTAEYSDLYEALGRLPEEMRLTVTLFYLEGYHVKEIASILNTTESTVKNRLLRARNRLKKDLEEMEAAGL